MSRYIPSPLRNYYQHCTDYSSEILDPTKLIQTELHAKNLFWTSAALFTTIGYTQLTVPLSFMDRALFAWCQTVCLISIICLRFKLVRHLPLILSVEIFFNNFTMAWTNIDTFFGPWGLTLVVPNFYMFLTQSKSMAFVGFLSSCFFNAVIGPRFRATLIAESGSAKLVEMFDVGLSFFNTFAFYNFAFCALSASQTERILQTLSQSLEVEQKMKQEKELLNSKTLFFSCFSHEMRNPLNCILGSMDYAIKYASDDAIRDILATGKACGSMLLNLINNILDMGKIDSNNICLNEDTKDSKVFITNIWRVTQELFKKKKQQGEIFVDRDFPVSIVIDDSRLSQVVVNLVSNACKFSDEGQSIRVIFSFEPEDPTIAPKSPISRQFSPVISPRSSINLGQAQKIPLHGERYIRPPSLAISRRVLPYSRPMQSIEDERVDQSQMLMVSQIKAKKSLDHVKTQSTRLSDRYVLLFTSYRSESHSIEWNPKSNPALVGQRGTIKVDVIDSGCGMTPDEIGKLFKPFEQANKAIYGTYGGTGLGLYITQSLIQLMKGTIVVESRPGGGSTFSVSIPNILPESASGESRLSSVMLKTNSPNSRVKIVIYSDKNLISEKEDLRRFFDRAIMAEYTVEKSNKFILPEKGRVSTSYAGLIQIYDIACLSQEQFSYLQKNPAENLNQKVLYYCSSDLPHFWRDIPHTDVIYHDSEALFAALQDHARQLLHSIKSKNTILIVDDDEFNRKIMSVFLIKEGYNVHTANNGQVGYDVYRQHAQEIKMVIVDYEMPICDGPTCAEMILKYTKQHNLPQVPIYALTGNVSQESKVRIAEAGIKKAWNKPAKMEEVMGEVFHILLSANQKL